MSNPKYPDCKVSLIGKDGNAFVILGITKKALRKHLLDDLHMNRKTVEEEVNKYFEEAISGDYNDLLCTTMKWVDVC